MFGVEWENAFLSFLLEGNSNKKSILQPRDAINWRDSKVKSDPGA